MSDERKNPVETMARFFDSRSKTYDDHRKELIASFDQLYPQVASCFPSTQAAVKILDLGCGTGIELRGILANAPNAAVTGIDLSQKMLDLLRAKYATHLRQITLVHGSYLTLDLGEGNYDYVVAVMTVHHLLPNSRLALYRRIRDALKPSGKYVEAEYVVSDEEEHQLRQEFEEICKSDASISDGSHHIDIPLSLGRTRGLLLEAGFAAADILWHQDAAAVHVAHP